MALGGRGKAKLLAALLLSMATPGRAQAPYVPGQTETREKEWRKLAAASQAAYASGKAEDGIATARMALALADELFGGDDPRSLISANDLALQLEASGRYHEAETLFRRVFDSYLRTRGDDDPNSQLALENLIDFYMARKRYDAAGPLADYALGSFRRTTGTTSPRSQRMAQIIATMPKSVDPVTAGPAPGNASQDIAPPITGSTIGDVEKMSINRTNDQEETRR